ncbi:MAG: SUMF1/EgtB/PvdO family nonheme iron enzyme [Polyangiaceae bacterium]|nr:SUMF1/EgtB/PvdO family nonheme iron enzyme [Polyangiaceae bacterium]
MDFRQLSAVGLLLSACAAPVFAPPAPPPKPGVKPAASEPAPVAPMPAAIPALEPAAAPAVSAAQPPEATAPPRCPEGMAPVQRYQGPYCIDRWEASVARVKADGSTAAHPFNQNVDGIEGEVRAVSRKGVRAQGYISGKQAGRACENAGKRLCEIDEWVRACRGPKLTRYPYGDQRRANVCNDRFQVLDNHPVPILWKKDPLDATDEKLMWHPRFMNDKRLLELPNTTTPTGAFSKCTNEYGVYDMVGNQHEWVNDPDGTFFGGFFMDTFQNGEGCEYRTLGHPFDYHDYSTGFRCCADPK